MNRKFLRLLRVEIRKPIFDLHPEKSTTNNSEWRQGFFLIFKDNYGNEYDWMPKYSELDEINLKRVEIEEINKELCRQNNGR